MAKSNGGTQGGNPAEPSPWPALTASAAALWFEAAAAAPKALAAAARRSGQLDRLDPDPIHLAPALRETAFALAKRPERTAGMLGELALDHFRLAQESLRPIWQGAAPDTDPETAPDPRFRNPAWNRSPFFRHLRKAYQLNVRCLEGLVDLADIQDPRTRRKASFATRLFADSLAPGNVPALNPEVTGRTGAELGRNLVEGARNWVRDFAAADGDPEIAQVDRSAFVIGESVAATPGKVIWRNDLLELIQYEPATKRVRAIPTLFLPNWINKYYVVDLQPKKSMVKWLTARGHTVFMISWVNPDDRHRNVGLEEMLKDGVLAAIDRTLEESGAESVNLAGYCIGGTLAGIALAYLAGRESNPVNSCTFFASQLDFSDAGDLMALTDSATVERLCARMDRLGYLSSSSMAGSFNAMRPGDLLWSFVIDNYYLGKPPTRFDLLYWNADSTRMAAKAHSEYLRGLYVENRLAKGTLEIGGRTLDLGRIEAPTYHVVGKDDHIAPAESVYRGMRLMGGDKRFVLADSGHIAGIVNPPMARKYGYRIDGDDAAPDPASWAEAAEGVKGSWWSDWIKWLNARSPRRVEARTPGAVLGVIDDAPGSYVRVRHAD